MSAGISIRNVLHARLSISSRLGLILVVMMIPIVLLLTEYVMQCWKDISFAQKEASGVIYLESIWPKFATFRAPGAGDDQTAQAFQNARSRYDGIFGVTAAANAFAAAKGQDQIQTAGVSLFTAVADSSNLTLDPDLDSFYVQDALTVQMPAVLQAAEDLRSAVSMPAARPDRRDAIAVAFERLLIYSRTAGTDLDSAMGNNKGGDTRAALDGLTTVMTRAIKALTDMREAVLNDPHLQVGTEVDAVGSAVRGTWLAGAQELARLLDARASYLQWSLFANLAVTALALLLAGFVALIVAMGLSSRIAALLHVMDRLVRGDVSSDVPYLTYKNETGRIARTVMAFKQSLVDGSALRLASQAQKDELAALEHARHLHEAELARQQSRVVELVASGLALLSGGDLSHALDEPFPADYEKLRADFNEATTKLRDTMRTVAASAFAINCGSNEISTAADSLSRRTEQQAASLEETAAALDEITATVRRTAEGARHARSVVGDAKANAAQSGTVVKQAMAAMNGIARSSGQITQIIGVIDEIAFQTNLLALNAGVEAARAGDAGRGFAVVASEVRALAQRSAEAAKEIKTLISSSGSQVEQGVVLVDRTGEALANLMAQVSEVDSIVGDISASAQEQATALDEVNTAVNQMDQVTQQNAAMVEESTAASQALAREISELSRLIGQFRLDRDGDGEARRRPQAAPMDQRSSAPAFRMLKSVGRGGVARKASAETAQSWDEF